MTTIFVASDEKYSYLIADSLFTEGNQKIETPITKVINSVEGLFSCSVLGDLSLVTQLRDILEDSTDYPELEQDRVVWWTDHIGILSSDEPIQLLAIDDAGCYLYTDNSFIPVTYYSLGTGSKYALGSYLTALDSTLTDIQSKVTKAVEVASLFDIETQAPFSICKVAKKPKTSTVTVEVALHNIENKSRY